MSKYMNAPHIKGHLPVLKEYAQLYHHVTEMGVREFNSTYAFLLAKPKKLVSIDWNRPPFEISPDELAMALELADEAGIDYEFVSADSVEVEIEPTDLLFIDTWHTYEQLLLELILHADNVRHHIIAHDTNELIFPGMSWAVKDFIEYNPHWEVERLITDGPGMTVIRRKGPGKTTYPETKQPFKEALMEEIREQRNLYYRSTDKDGSTNPYWEAYKREQAERFESWAGSWPVDFMPEKT